MYVRPLNYNRPAAIQLLDIFNMTNKTAIEPWQVTFGDPYVIPDTAPEFVPNQVNNFDLTRPTIGTLTRIEVHPTPESGWRKTLQLTYRREVIQDKFAAVPLVIYAKDYEDTVILEELSRQYGLYLDPHLVTVDLQPVDINDVIFQTHMGSILETDICGDYIPPVTYDAVIKMDAKHPLYIGEIRVYIREAVEFLERNVKTTLEVRRYLGPGDHNKMPAEMILPNNRFTDQDHLLRDLEVGELIGPWIVDIAKSISPDDWVFTQAANNFNLYGARVVYNGLNTGNVYNNDPRVSNLVIIQFSDVHCKNIAGQWVIGYYNQQSWLRQVRIDHMPIQDQ